MRRAVGARYTGNKNCVAVWVEAWRSVRWIAAFYVSVVVVAGGTSVVSGTPAIAGEASYAPKLLSRVSNGILQNTGTVAGSSLDLGGMSLQFVYYLGSQVSVGLGYRASFDLTKGTVPLSGWEVPLRYYWLGTGTHITTEGNEANAQRMTSWAAYAGGQFGIRSYFLGSDPTVTASTQSISGGFLTVDALIGVEKRLSRHFELTAEGLMGVKAFAASDVRYSVKSMLLLVGVSYIW